MSKYLYTMLVLFLISNAHGADDFMSIFKEVNAIIDKQITRVTTGDINPGNNYATCLKELQPVERFITGLGNRNDPVTNVFWTSFDQLKLCLKTYYELGMSTTSPYIQTLDASHQAQFKKTFIRIMQSYTTQVVTCFKMYLQMCLYENAENYAEFFPTNVMENHKLFMTQTTEALQKFYLTKFMTSLRLDIPEVDEKFFTAVYKAYKSFSFDWQKIILDSWNAHHKAFHRIAPEGFPKQLSAIMECNKKLESLKMLPDWKNKLASETFALQVFEYFKEHHIDVIAEKDLSYIVLHPLPRSTTSSSSSMQPTLQTSDQTAKETPVLTATAAALPLELSTASIDLPPLLLPASPILPSEPPIAAESDMAQSQPGTPGTSFITQAQDMFTFYRSMEPELPQPLAHAAKATGKKSKKEAKSKQSRSKPRSDARKSEASSPQPQASQALLPEQDRIVLTLSQKQTREAINDFIRAFQSIEPTVRSSLDPRVIDAFKLLHQNPHIKLNKAYKLMLRIVPHVGEFKLDRGKGSHALIIIYPRGRLLTSPTQ